MRDCGLRSPLTRRGRATELLAVVDYFCRPCRGLFLLLFLPPMATRWGETQENVAQGSLSSLAAFPPRRGLGGAAMGNSDYLVCGAARARTAGRAAGPERGPCAMQCAEHVRQLGGESPLPTLMEVKG